MGRRVRWQGRAGAMPWRAALSPPPSWRRSRAMRSHQGCSRLRLAAHAVCACSPPPPRGVRLRPRHSHSCCSACSMLLGTPLTGACSWMTSRPARSGGCMQVGCMPGPPTAGAGVCKSVCGWAAASCPALQLLQCCAARDPRKVRLQGAAALPPPPPPGFKPPPSSSAAWLGGGVAAPSRACCCNKPSYRVRPSTGGGSFFCPLYAS